MSVLHVLPRRIGLLRASFSILIASLLAACGGGGDSGGGGGGATRSQIGGSVSGLAAGASVVLLNNGGDAATVSANGAFTFATAINNGSAYAVTVGTQPVAQTCSVQNGAGTVAGANVNNVVVTCSNSSYTVSGTINGLLGSGLVLQNNGGDNQSPAAGATSFSFPPIAGSSPYAVTVASQPLSPSQNCVVTANGSGPGGAGNVSNAVVTCTVNTFPVNVNVMGLAGAGLVLRNNGGDNLAVNTPGMASFTGQVASGAGYNVTVFSQPVMPSQSCVPTAGSGTMGNGPVTVTITCTTVTRSIGGTVSGLVGTGLLLRNNGGDTLVVAPGQTTFTFPTLMASGATYAVTVFQHPSSPGQTCTVTNGSGTVGTSNVSNVAVNCISDRYTVGGTVSGLGSAGGSLVLQNNGGDDLTISTNGSFTFATSVQTGTAYAVTRLTNPANRICDVSSGSGTMASANVVNVVVRCRSRFAFFSNESGTPSVSNYTVGAAGGFTLAGTLPVQGNSTIPGAHATGVAVTPSGGHVIVAVDQDPVTARDGELHVYSVNTSTGALAYVSKAPVASFAYCGGVPNNGAPSCGINFSPPTAAAITSAPETVVVHPNGRFVYVMDGVARGSCQNSSNPCDTPKEGHRIIIPYIFDPQTATLSLLNSTVNGYYIEGFISMAMDPRGRFLWGTSYLDRKITELRINQTTGALTGGTGTFIGMSNGDMWFGIDPNGNYAYVSHAGDQTIDAYTIDQTTGHLTNIGAINGDCSALGANCSKATGVIVSSMAVAANGRTLYGVLGSGAVIAYALGADGRIGAQLPGSPFASANPMSGYRGLVSIDASGQLLYLQGYAETSARVFSINQTSGVLTEVAGVSPTPLASGSSGTTAISLQ